MSNQTNKLTQAYAAFQQRRYPAAREILADCTHPQAAHLRGLVERRLGRFDEALSHLNAAIDAEPNNPEIHHNQSLVLLDLHQPSSALTSASRAIQLNPEFVAAYRTLGRALRMSEQWDHALAFYRDFVERWPGEVSARYGLGMAELETGRIEEALARFAQLMLDGAGDSSVHFMHGRAALEAGQVETARISLQESHRLAPSALSLRELGRLYWMQGDRQAFTSLLEAPFPSPEMMTVALQLLRQSGADPEQLAALLDTQASPSADHEASVAQGFVDSGNAGRARHYAMRGLGRQRDHDGAMAANISALLMQGEAQAALELSRQKRAEQPDAQQWIAYESTALRLLGSDEYVELVDPSHHIQVFTLPVPEGYDTLGAFNRALEAALADLQLFNAEPIDQSLRGGTQTARDLRSVDDPVVQDYVRALDAPIREYLSLIGTSPDHPLSARNTGGYALSGCWSVRLSSGGHHVNHMHPEGWISSAYYVRVPETKAGTRSGWIHFSQPPFPTQPALEPERWIEPQVGMLVLFPSYLWHGTEPIVDDAVRVTAPFDAVPM